MSRPLLVLRPAPGSARSADAIRAHGLTAIEAPLFTIAPLAWIPPPAERFDALALTSANAVRWAGPALSAYAALPVYAVGRATAEAATAASLTVRYSGEGDGAALAQAAVDAGVTRLLHLCGGDHHRLDRAGLEVAACPVYVARPIASLPAAAVEALRTGTIALLHSPRAAAVFAALVDAATIARAGVVIAAISPAAAAAAGSGWAGVAIAERPSDDALLAAALAMCDHPG